MIVVLEGGDASGKATQSKILAERLGAALFAFPDYNTDVGKAILGNLKENWYITSGWDETDSGGDPYIRKEPRTNALVLQSLMLTNRMELGTNMLAASTRQHLVIDRYDASSFVYGVLDGLDPSWLWRANRALPVKPDLYILLDVPVEEGFKRRPERRDRYESSVKRMEDVRVAYLKLFNEKHEADLARARGDGKTRNTFIPGPTWRIVDGIGSIEEVSARIWDALVSSPHFKA